MLPLELIGVLGLCYVLSMIGTMKANRVKGSVRRSAKVGTEPVARDLSPETAKPIV